MNATAFRTVAFSFIAAWRKLGELSAAFLPQDDFGELRVLPAEKNRCDSMSAFAYITRLVATRKKLGSRELSQDTAISPLMGRRFTND